MCLFGEPERAELDAIGAERIGFEHVSTGTHIFRVHAGDQARLREVQFIEAAIEEDALGVQQGAHRAVADEHAFGQSFEEGAAHFNEPGVLIQRPTAPTCPR